MRDWPEIGVELGGKPMRDWPEIGVELGEAHERVAENQCGIGGKPMKIMAGNQCEIVRILVGKKKPGIFGSGRSGGERKLCYNLRRIFFNMRSGRTSILIPL